MEDTPQSKGGFARAQFLTQEQRREIARTAAQSRWQNERPLPRATHSGTLKLADIPCYVLDTGERILSTRGIMKSLKRTWRGRKYAGTELPVFLEAKNLKPFISEDLASVLTPRTFRTHKGSRSEGYIADILPVVCEVYLRARDEGELTRPQELIAKQCEILIRGLSRVGITALVDEATGYQEVRDKLALQAILDRFLRQNFAAWAKRFPDEFYQHIFRLRGWQWRGMEVNRPQIVANYTKDLVYARLAPGILQELEARNPKDEKGARKAAHHQWLTEEVGHPALAQHLYAVIGLMRLADSWDQLKRMVDKAYPKRGDSLQLPLFTEISP
jgi:P63C domain